MGAKGDPRPHTGQRGKGWGASQPAATDEEETMIVDPNRLGHLEDHITGFHREPGRHYGNRVWGEWRDNLAAAGSQCALPHATGRGMTPPMKSGFNAANGVSPRDNMSLLCAFFAKTKVGPRKQHFNLDKNLL